MIHPDYIRTAHRRAIYQEIQRLLMEKYVAVDRPAKEPIICEEVPFSNKEVTQEALLEVLNTIELLQQEERVSMSQFEMRRKNVQPKPSEGASPSLAPHKKKPKPKQGAVPTSSPAGEATGTSGGSS